jgi:hypothetical protein
MSLHPNGFLSAPAPTLAAAATPHPSPAAAACCHGRVPPAPIQALPPPLAAAAFLSSVAPLLVGRRSASTLPPPAAPSLTALVAGSGHPFAGSTASSCTRHRASLSRRRTAAGFSRRVAPRGGCRLHPPLSSRRLRRLHRHVCCRPATRSRSHVPPGPAPVAAGVALTVQAAAPGQGATGLVPPLCATSPTQVAIAPVSTEEAASCSPSLPAFSGSGPSEPALLQPQAFEDEDVVCSLPEVEDEDFAPEVLLQVAYEVVSQLDRVEDFRSLLLEEQSLRSFLAKQIRSLQLVVVPQDGSAPSLAQEATASSQDSWHV